MVTPVPDQTRDKGLAHEHGDELNHIPFASETGTTGSRASRWAANPSQFWGLRPLSEQANEEEQARGYGGDRARLPAGHVAAGFAAIGAFHLAFGVLAWT
ncbi:hypothetical protein ACOZ4I_18340 (plasmid) [Haloarcula salina]|uniref:hypothetical protein n=1 Tax=Haloarcula salina TaxID=1429914 RepID=UPI003C6F72EC